MFFNLVCKYFSFLSETFIGFHRSFRWTWRRLRTFWWVFRSHETFWQRFFKFSTLNVGVSKNWSITLFCDLARELLSIFSRNDLQKSKVSWAQSSCSVTNCLALTISSSETKAQYLSVMFLILKTANSILLHNRDTSSFWILSVRIKIWFIHFVKLPIRPLLLAFNILIFSRGC